MLDFIVNPIAGGKKGKVMQKNLALIQQKLNEEKIDFKIHFTDGKHHATKLTEELIANGSTTIVAVGGDGTLHEVINGFSNFDKVALGIIPCGTGNDFAAALKLPSDPVEALELIIKGKPKYTDFMQMPTVRGLNVIGMGIDVDVLNRYEKLKKKTKFGYTKCLIATLFNFNYTEFEADFNGEARSYRSFIACVANGHRFGGGLEVCPVASPTDGLLDFVAMKEIPKIKIINAFIKLKKGKLLTLKQAIHDRTEKIVIKSPIPYTVNVDGELYDNIPFEVEVIKDTLRVYR